MNNTFIAKQITKEIEVSIISAGPEYSLDEAIWAVNWFDVKNKGLYDFYNIIASSHVRQVGGSALFKGSLIKRISGDKNDERKVLLIVSYPKPDSFLEMLTSKMFQIKSLIRELAVEDFTFGFMKRLDDGEMSSGNFKKYEGNLIYMVHHFKSQNTIDTSSIKELAAEQDIFTHFSGIKSALVGRKKKDGKLRTSPFLMDGMLIFGAFEENQFEGFIASEFYKTFISQNQSNYIALFKREV